MSPFHHWCRQAHYILKSAGLKLPYGHVQQVLARGLGHQSLFDLQKADLGVLDRAAFALLDEAAMLERAAELRTAITPKLSNDVCLDLRGTRGAPTLIRERYFDVPARGAFPASDDETFDAIAAPLVKDLPGHYADHPQVLRATPRGDFQQGRSWSWDVQGTVLALKNHDGYEVPFTATLEFRSIGLRLLSLPIVHNLLPSGPPEPWDPGVTDFAYLSDSDS